MITIPINAEDNLNLEIFSKWKLNNRCKKLVCCDIQKMSEYTPYKIDRKLWGNLFFPSFLWKHTNTLFQHLQFCPNSNLFLFIFIISADICMAAIVVMVVGHVDFECADFSTFVSSSQLASMLQYPPPPHDAHYWPLILFAQISQISTHNQLYEFLRRRPAPGWTLSCHSHSEYSLSPLAPDHPS